ncbi:hypothetical protein [Kitasatospora acidiphila]|uniref:hypothetical protein n=1 Tax=Kitasatospora acidiphila TaxID=2567942 RepID=UPI0015F10714|nr:hypothetical protein [Kitasatospora acidiphila]
MLCELLSALPDVELIDDLPIAPTGEFQRQLRLLRPDVVVWRLDDDSLLAEHPEFFGAEHPNLVITIHGDGDCGTLWRLRPHRAELGALGPSTLAAAIRSAATPCGAIESEADR